MNWLCLVVSSAAIFVWSSVAMGILAEDYIAIRILEPPAEHPPADCMNFVESRQGCGAGPAYVAGISNAGDAAGNIETNFPHIHHNEEAIRWLRRTGYAGENIRRYEMAPDSVDQAGNTLRGGRAKGIKGEYVTSGGFFTGQSSVTNTESFHYDIVNDRWWHLGPGGGQKGNNFGRGVVREYPCCSPHSRVTDIALVQEPFTTDETAVVQVFPKNTIVEAINDHDVIVGWFDPTCLPTPTPLCFGGQDPMKILPTSENTWGEKIPLDELTESSKSEVIDLSNTEPAYGIGTSDSTGVVWNIETGNIIAQLGAFANPLRINSAGTMIVGNRVGFSLPPTRDALVWWSLDGWQTVEELTMDAVLDAVPGGDAWENITRLTGVNDAGQLSGMGTLKGEFGQLSDPSVTNWNSELATGFVCSGGRFFQQDDGCGIPFILDTLALTALKGDVNNDGMLNNLDITPFIAALAAADEPGFLTVFSEGNYTAADVDMSGEVNNLDITPFIAELAAAASDSVAAPEPGSLAYLVVASAIMMRSRRRGR